MRGKGFLRVWLIIGLVSGFLAGTFFIITYTNDNLLCDVDCRCKNEIQILFTLIALTGLFIGSLTYYFMSEKNEKELIRIQKDVSATLNFLDPDQKKVISALLKAGCSTTQSRLVRDSGLGRVKVSRVLKKLENKKIILREKSGMTNKIRLSKELDDLFTN